MRLKTIVDKLDTANLIGEADQEINSLAYDSRRVKSGGLFFAISGFKHDGHKYIDNARGAGASAVVVERRVVDSGDKITQIVVPNSRRALAVAANVFYDYPSSKFDLIGVTGTNGKTTTAYLIERVLAAAGFKTGLISTIEYKIGDRVLLANRTTPESLDLQKLLAEMAEAKVKAAVMEVSSHAVQLKRVDATRFSALVFTNLTQDHLDFHQSMDSYFQAKTALFTQSQFKQAARIVNIDDTYGRQLRDILNKECVTYGFNSEADVVGSKLEYTKDGLSLTVSGLGRTLDISTRLKGIFNSDNILAAVTTAWKFNIDDIVINQALGAVENIPGRFQAVDQGQDFQVIVDYAHTPDGLKQVLKSARLVAAGKLVTVFGCGGDRDRKKRPLMGAIAAQLSDELIVTSDNPRSEDPERIIKDIISGINADQSVYKVIPDRRQAINEALGGAKKGDLVLIAGKGHETGQILADRVVPFDDILVAEQILREIINDNSKSA